MSEDLPQQTLLLELEDAILKIEAQGWDESSIFAFVNMILKGYITNGTFAEDYLKAAADALQQRQSMTRTVDAPPKIIIARN